MAEIAQLEYAFRKLEMTQAFYEELTELERFRDKEILAATKIQSLIRKYLQRKQYLIQIASATRIKSTFKGFQTRKAFWKMQDEEVSRNLLCYYEFLATEIQKTYRGYYSRKYVHDFYARKKYLLHIQAKNEKRREKLEAYALKNEAEDQKRQEDNARLEFYKLASNLHHLTSTKAIPGVYRGLETVSDFGKHTLV